MLRLALIFVIATFVGLACQPAQESDDPTIGNEKKDDSRAAQGGDRGAHDADRGDRGHAAATSDAGRLLDDASVAADSASAAAAEQEPNNEVGSSTDIEPLDDASTTLGARDHQDEARVDSSTPLTIDFSPECLDQSGVATSPLCEEFHELMTAGDAPSLGPSSAAVTIVEYCDHLVPYCHRNASGLDTYVAGYPGRVRVVFRQFPLGSAFDNGTIARAFLAAHEQGRYDDYRRYFYDNSTRDTEQLVPYARAIGLDIEQFTEDMEALADAVEADKTLGTSVGVEAVPTMFVNGVFVSGAQNLWPMLQELLGPRVESETVAPTPESSEPNPLLAPADVAEPPANAQKSSSGLAWIVLEPGSDQETPGPNDRVQVHYTGWTKDGKTFDSSVVRGPSTFAVDQVIPGLSEGFQLMTKGEKRRFWIPAELAYGETPRPGAPVGQVTFDIHLLDIFSTP